MAAITIHYILVSSPVSFHILFGIAHINEVILAAMNEKRGDFAFRGVVYWLQVFNLHATSHLAHLLADSRHHHLHELGRQLELLLGYRCYQVAQGGKATVQYCRLGFVLVFSHVHYSSCSSHASAPQSDLRYLAS